MTCEALLWSAATGTVHLSTSPKIRITLHTSSTGAGITPLTCSQRSVSRDGQLLAHAVAKKRAFIARVHLAIAAVSYSVEDWVFESHLRPPDGRGQTP